MLSGEFVDTQQRSLDSLLAGVYANPDTNFRFTKMGSGRFMPSSKVQTPAYQIPILQYDGRTYGIFSTGSRVETVPVGVAHIEGRRQHFYHFKDGRLIKVQGSPSHDTVYLPLRELDLMLEDHGELKPVFGIEDSNRAYPLLFVSRDGKQVFFDGLTHARGSLETFTFRDNYDRRRANDTLDFLADVRRGAIAEYVEHAADSYAILTVADPEVTALALRDIPFDPTNAQSIYEFLGQTVIGQEEAKRALAVAFSDYELRRQTGNASIPRGPVLLSGPTGSGKTFLVHTLAQAMGLPFFPAKASGKSGTGYVGSNFSDILIPVAEGTEGSDPHAILFLDEADKLRYAKNSFADSIQDQLLAWTCDEGDLVRVSVDKVDHPLHTRNLMVVLAGAFSGTSSKGSLVELVRNRLGTAAIGFGKGSSRRQEFSDDEVLALATKADYVQYGLKPELVGRIKRIVPLRRLTTDQMVQILENPHGSALQGALASMRARRHPVIYDRDALRTLVEACPMETGARELDDVVTRVFEGLKFRPEEYARADGVIELTPQLVRQQLGQASARDANADLGEVEVRSAEGA